jgi:hypothetical protein
MDQDVTICVHLDIASVHAKFILFCILYCFVGRSDGHLVELFGVDKWVAGPVHLENNIVQVSF